MTRDEWVDKQIKDWVLPKCSDRHEAETALSFFPIRIFLSIACDFYSRTKKLSIF